MLGSKFFKKLDQRMGSKTLYRLVKYYALSLAATLRASSFAMCSSYDFLSDEAKGVLGSECQTGPWLVGCWHAAACQRLKKINRHHQIFAL